MVSIPDLDLFLEKMVKEEMYPMGRNDHFDVVETALSKLVQRMTGQIEVTPQHHSPTV